MVSGQVDNKRNGTIRINSVINNYDKNKNIKSNVYNNFTTTNNNNIIKNKVISNQRINYQKNYKSNKNNYVDSNYSNRRNNHKITYKKWQLISFKY